MNERLHDAAHEAGVAQVNQASEPYRGGGAQALSLTMSTQEGDLEERKRIIMKLNMSHVGRQETKIVWEA